MATISLGVLGVLGAMLAVTGIFGMASYSVSKRLRELGIRVALGAQRKEVLRAALGRTFRLLATGAVAGLLLGMAATRVLSYIVYQATTTIRRAGRCDPHYAPAGIVGCLRSGPPGSVD